MRIVKSVACLAIGLIAVSAAPAGYTTVGSSSETQFLDVFNHLYGPGFTGAPFGGLAYTNGTITATRIDDFGVGSPLNVRTGGPGIANDQVWQDGTISVAAEARFARFDQRFGYDVGADGGYQNLFDVQGSGFDVTGGVDGMTLGGLFTFAQRSSLGGTHYSKNALNAGDRDHMVTYEITGLGTKTWLLFWEDSSAMWGDWDFNDLVVEVQTVPAPAAVVLGAIGVTGVGIAVWLKKRFA